MDKALQAIVWSNLDDAKDNGYSFEGWSDYDIAVDLTCYAPDCEDYSPETLEPYVNLWRFANG